MTIETTYDRATLPTSVADVKERDLLESGRSTPFLRSHRFAMVVCATVWDTCVVAVTKYLPAVWNVIVPEDAGCVIPLSTSLVDNVMSVGVAAVGGS